MIFTRLPPSGFIITLECSFNILKNSRHLKQLGFREIWGGGQSILALLGKVGGYSVSNSENAEVGVWAIPSPGIDAVVHGFLRRWLVLFYYDIPTDDPADWSLSELAAPGETRWDFLTSISQEKLLALTECAFHDLTLLNKQVQH